MQQGPVQVLRPFLSFDVFRPEHFICNHCLHVVHWTDVDVSFFVQMGQYQMMGPGFCSMPARISKSQIRHAGVAFSFVKLIKNTF